MPVMHLIAGPHGAGKSIFYQYFLSQWFPQRPLVDALAHANAHLQHIVDPANRAHAARCWADEQRQEMFQHRRSFVTETAFSHPSRVALVAQARTLGYLVVIYALSVDEPRRLLTRVNQRVREGGHSVPSHKVLDRYTRCMDNLRQAIFIADFSILLDAADAHLGGPRLIASMIGRQMKLHVVLRPRWVEKVLGFSEG
jgi:predicted ABC-type ATPase